MQLICAGARLLKGCKKRFFTLFCRHRERSEAIHLSTREDRKIVTMDCHVANTPRNDGEPGNKTPPESKRRHKLALPFRLALREWRGGTRGFRIFLGCLILGVAVMATVLSLGSAIRYTMAKESRTLLGGDVEIYQSNSPISAEQLSFIQHYGTPSLTLEMRAMAHYKETNTLVELKAIDAHYPLVGTLETSPATSKASGSDIIVARELLERLNAQMGDSITIASATFRIAGILEREPDRIVNAFSFGPRLLLTHEQLTETGLIMPGALVRYRYRVLLNEGQSVKTFTTALEKAFPKNSWRVRDASEANESLKQFIGRLEMFLSLAALATLLLGGVGISGAVRAFLDKKATTIAILKTLGSSERTVFQTYGIFVSIVTLVGVVIGLAIAVGVTALLLPSLSTLLPTDSGFRLYPGALLGAGWFGAITVATFAFSPIDRGIQVRPAMLMRGGELRQPIRTQRGAIYTVYALILLIVSLMIVTPNSTISSGFVLMAAVSFLLFHSCGKLVQSLAKRITSIRTPWLRLAISNLHRPGNPTNTIIMAIGIGLTVMVTLVLVEGNIQKRITETIPHEAPSLFMLDIQPYQKEEILAKLAQNPAVSHVETTPMVRGTISAIKGIPVDQLPEKQQKHWTLRGDRGFTYATTLPVHSNIVQGEWWVSDYHGTPLVSVDSALEKDLDLALGDHLTLSIAGEEVDVTIASFRKVDYATLNINFALVLSPGVIEDLPHTFLATLRVSDEPKEIALVNGLATDFPNVSAIRISETLQQVNTIIGYISIALTITVSITLVAGILVLSGALTAVQDKRIYDTVLFKLLGAKRRTIIAAYLTEWLILGAITALIASGLGSFGAWMVLDVLNNPEFYMMYPTIIATLLGCLSFVSLLGFITNAHALNTKPAPLLRNE